ncbi:FAD-dependent monooxygenase [Kitasatospora nipponensis]|uniref:FAD-dependent monooxygenase n=1 Tax=Kitasatospora nipponensis TaxID=258049 RepID=A0ABN1X3E9_9ACTN
MPAPTTPTTAVTTPVLIVGGGPVGLTLSVLLSAHGVDHLLVEARPDTSRHPKARGISARSMEVLRRCGLEEPVRRAGLPASQVHFYRGRSLVDPHYVRTGLAPGAPDGEEATPSPGLICSQDVLEPILRRRAERAGPGRIRFGTRLLSFARGADDQGVRAVLRNVVTGEESLVHAGWLVGCDGVASTVRAGAGIALSGPTGLGHYLSIRFEAPLGPVVADRASASYFLTEPGRGGFMAVDNDRRWIYQYPVTADALGADDTDLTDPLYLAELVRTAAGIPDLAVTVQDTLGWRMDARLADRYRSSRVLLAGDAAHVVPPTGGHGMNTGIGDADNLAWKLAAVVAGQAGSALLDSYEAERRPLARQVIELSTANAGARAGYRIDDELLLTARYRSCAVVPDDDLPAPRPPLDPAGHRPGAGPGDRAPHVWLDGAGAVTSTLDLLGPGFTLVVQGEAPSWRRQAAAAAAAGLPVTVRPLTTARQHEREPGRWLRLCGVPADGAVLVRPDGHLAWRAPRPPADEGTLLAVLRRVLGGDV